jgi:hypothetical protein
MEIGTLGKRIIKIFSMVRDKHDTADICFRLNAANHVENKVIRITYAVVIRIQQRLAMGMVCGIDGLRAARRLKNIKLRRIAAAVLPVITHRMQNNKEVPLVCHQNTVKYW